MRKIKLMTDCTSDLSDELYSRYDIEVLPLYVTVGGRSYADKLEINPEKLFELAKQYNEVPKTSTISRSVLHEAFQKYLALDYDILFISLGSAFSGVYQNATLMAQEFEAGRIRIIDSKNLSSGIGLLVLKAAKFLESGDDLETAARKVEAIVPNVRTMFSINTLEYLHKGGRCSGTSRLFGTLLKIKPIIRVVNGAMEVAKKPRGKFETSLDTQLEYVEHDKELIDPDYIMITHCMADEDAKYLRTRLEKMVKVNCILETHAVP
jgi:DegV family protein with EDD domain